MISDVIKIQDWLFFCCVHINLKNLLSLYTLNPVAFTAKPRCRIQTRTGLQSFKLFINKD